MNLKKRRDEKSSLLLLFIKNKIINFANESKYMLIMNIKKRLKLFYKFLKKENILQEYITNVKNGSKFRKKYGTHDNYIDYNTYYKFLTLYIKNYPRYMFLDGFNWVIQKDSIKWGDVHCRWIKLCQKNNIL